MFETIQIARRHLLRFEYPEKAADSDAALSVSLGDAGPEPGILRSSEGQASDRDGDEGDHEENHLLFGWSLFPYY